MRKCACCEHIKHISICEQIHDIQTRCVYIGFSDIGILCSRMLWEFVGICDWNRLPTAELDCHDLQNGRENQIQSRYLQKWCTRSIMFMECLTKCLVQTATAPPT